jgi:hypothetical protein
LYISFVDSFGYLFFRQLLGLRVAVNTCHSDQAELREIKAEKAAGKERRQEAREQLEKI